MMGTQAADCSAKESVIVVIDGHKSKGSMDAVDWALKHVVCRRDTVIVLGVVGELKKRNSCFLLNTGIGISGIWEKLEFSSQGQGEVRPRELGEEIERKREQYQKNLQPFYRQCKKNEVILEAKLAFGFCPQKITIEQAKKSNPRWIVLDSHLKKHKFTMYGHVGCNIAVMKGKDVATLIQLRAPPPYQPSPRNCSQTMDSTTFSTAKQNNNENGISNIIQQEGDSSSQTLHSQTPSWYPLSWRTGYPHAFSQAEIETITNGFAEDNVVESKDEINIYEGILQETPVLVMSFSENDERFWMMVKILSRVRHRNILNLVGYCCTAASMFLLTDYPCMGTVEINLQYDELAKNLSWKARWYIAMEIGGSLRYLHEECADGTIVHHSLCSSNIVFSHGCSAMLANFVTARWLKHDPTSKEDSKSIWPNPEEDERLIIDVRDYGIFLIELISGKSARLFQNQGEEKSLVDWALPLLENGPLSQLLDPRLEDISDIRVVHQMAKAALLCLQNNSGHKLSISQVLVVVRSGQLAMEKGLVP